MKKIFLILIALNYNIQAQNALLLKNASLIDGTGRSIQKGVNILIAGDSIHSIILDGENVSFADYQSVDLRGKYLLPGLFDAHVHFATDPSGGDKLELVKDRLALMLKNGVTGVRDMAGDTRQLAYLARQTQLDEIKAPDLYFSTLMAGPAFFDDPRTKSSGQGVTPGHVPWMKAITDETDIVKAVAEAKGTGASGIKIYADLPGHLARKVIEEAHRQDFLVWAHAAVIPGMPSDLINAGIDGVSHATLLAWEAAKVKPENGKQRYNDTELSIDNEAFKSVIKMMSEKQVYLDPTVAIYKGRYSPNIYNNGLKATAAAFNSGVNLVVGTDRGINVEDFKHLAIIDEMEVLVNEVNIPAIDVIKAATLNTAEFLNIDDNVGSIEVGKKANILIVDSNPLDDIINLKKVFAVYKNGKKID
jgi:imidazolonepropionase-like amidohydrolase